MRFPPPVFEAAKVRTALPLLVKDKGQCPSLETTFLSSRGATKLYNPGDPTKCTEPNEDVALRPCQLFVFKRGVLLTILA